ncbi:MAG: FtsB family cell division protein [Anaerotignaceae bacterium]
MSRVKRKKQKSFTAVLGVVFILTFLIVVCINASNKLVVLNALKQSSTVTSKLIEEEKYKNIQLQNQQEYYASDAYIEKMAREQLGLVMPDEVVFKSK